MYTHTLLLVDDSPTIEQEIRSAFADESIQVVVAVNGHRALDRIEAYRPDVVLASTTALGVNGYGLAHYVSQRTYLRNVAVLLLTADVSAADTHRMKESGARGFVRYPFEPGAVIARVKEVLMLAGPEIAEIDVLGQLTTAFDAIDASMTSTVFSGKPHANEITITPEALTRIVNEAVTQAIAAYEQSRGSAPAPARETTTRSGPRPTAVPPSPWRTEQQRLQRDMGLNDIEFEPKPAPPPPAQAVVFTDLTAQMGVHEFTIEDTSPAAAVSAVVATEPHSYPFGAATDQVRETPAPDSTGDFEYHLEDLPPRAAARDTFAASPSAPPEADPRIEESAESVPSVFQPLREAVVLLGAALAGQASRFRSALAERAQRRAEERIDAVPPAEPAPSLQSEPEPAPRLEAEAEPEPAPPPQPQARPGPQTPASAESIFFTFDPIPPVPPELPREPRKDRTVSRGR